MKQTKQGHIARLGPATKNSWAGLKAAYKHEIAFRQYVCFTLILLPTAWFISTGFTDFAILISALFLILITELLNSGIEAVVDRIGLEHHELSGRAKDLGSAAVFIAIFYFLIVWGYKLVFYFNY